MSKKLKVIVLMGGKSPEYEISLISGREVIRNLDKRKYKISSMIVSKEGGQVKLAPNKTDLVFIALHGSFGENGAIQGMLELAGLRYTGSGVLASALGIDKLMFRKVMGYEGITIPKYIVVRKGEKISSIDKLLSRPPYFVKPHNQGSSVGASVVKNKKELSQALNLAFQYSTTALVDEYLEGIEVTVPVIGNARPEALPIIEIIPEKGEFFDYDSKYTRGGSKEIVPARISSNLTKKVQAIALQVYKIMGCRGFARVDFILKGGEIPYLLEVNTIPGLTPASLFPKSAKAFGMSYPELLDKIIEYALE